MPIAVDGTQVTSPSRRRADFLRRKADDDGYRQCVATAVRTVTGAQGADRLRARRGAAAPSRSSRPPPTDDEWVARFVSEFDAEEIVARPRPRTTERERGQLMPQPNMNQMMKQVQKMQKDMMAAQEQLANETVRRPRAAAW